MSYLKVVREHGCLVCYKTPVQAHHLLRAGGKGMAIKAPDKWAIPLCNYHHIQLHHSGDEKDFFESYCIEYGSVTSWAEENWNEYQRSKQDL